jgi:hypothetical protein
MADEPKWTSVSLTREQKERLDDAKPEGMSRGTFIAKAAESYGKESNRTRTESIDYAEIESRMERVLERNLR